MGTEASSTDLIQAHVLITGRVQGVGYRFSTATKAKSLALQGWVRNLPDGRVEAVFEGAKWQVERMINWCYTGPSAAVVRDIETRYERIQGLDGFEVRY
ncbi:MAG: acylphosphatase [Cyanobacteria bacterium P01_G01_bin.54]